MSLVSQPRPLRTLNASSSFSRTCMCRGPYASCNASCSSALHAETMPLPRVDVSALATSDVSPVFSFELSVAMGTPPVPRGEILATWQVRTKGSGTATWRKEDRVECHAGANARGTGHPTMMP
eukprot:scaffold426_cov319-Pavlova_lutheri.AAC.16